jgi:hypothetical protein
MEPGSPRHDRDEIDQCWQEHDWQVAPAEQAMYLADGPPEKVEQWRYIVQEPI